MDKQDKYRPLEDSLKLLMEKTKQKPISVGEIVEIFTEKGRYLILIFFTLPFLIPITIPGLSVPFGLIIAIIGARMMFQRHTIWLFRFLRTKQLSSSAIQKIANFTLKVMKKIKRFIHPRVPWLCQSSVMHIINGFVIGILGIFLALPLPIPLTNLPPAWSLFLIALGLLEDDGVLVILGYLTTLCTVIFFASFAVAIKSIFDLRH